MDLSLTEFDFAPAAGAKSQSSPLSSHETASNETFKYLCVESCLPPSPAVYCRVGEAGSHFFLNDVLMFHSFLQLSVLVN